MQIGIIIEFVKVDPPVFFPDGADGQVVDCIGREIGDFLRVLFHLFAAELFQVDGPVNLPIDQRVARQVVFPVAGIGAAAQEGIEAAGIPLRIFDWERGIILGRSG